MNCIYIFNRLLVCKQSDWLLKIDTSESKHFNEYIFFFYALCIRCRPGAEVLGIRVLVYFSTFLKYSYSYSWKLWVMYSYSYSLSAYSDVLSTF